MAPITLTKQQFLQKRPGGHYDNYLSFVAKRRGNQLGQQNVDPFAPQSPQSIDQTISRFTGMYGTPQTDAQIQTSAQSQIDPIIAAITKAAEGRAAGSSAAIKGLTDSYAHDLAGVNYAAPYQQAEGQQAAVDAALQQSLTGAGSDLASQLKANLSSLGAGDPAVAQAASGLADRGAAIGTTELAHGSSALSNLIAQAAAASSYGQELPGIAKLSGIQGVAAANSQAANDISTGTQSALSQLPQIVQALRAENSNLRGNQASGAASLYETLTGQNLTKATAKAGLVNDQTSAQITSDYNNSRLGIAQQNANTASTRAATAQRAAAKKAKTAKAPKPLTVSEKQGAAATANTLATQAKNGAPAVLNANGTVKEAALPKLTRKQAEDEMRQEGLFADPRTAKIAYAALNRVYGKPLTPAQKKKQNAAVNSGLGLPSLTTGQSASGH